MELFEFGLRIGAALISGLFIGMEREIHNKNAGLKTNALVALGAASFVLISLHFEGEPYVDTTRVLGQVVTGIGFIGAGVILHKGTVVRGLTTAATVWCSAGAGCLAAIGEFQELFLLTAIIVLVNILFNPVDRFIARIFGHKEEDRTDD
ncbi:MgtC/SapB family protein [Salinimicrobium oceani]|uniref:MgtC/SapB family protein n=1 Tax=Salinimicrobium oceani TaxID=2722702 RepID=A0ABX1CXG0_9FLAO|nr:MgtC/SapB family protein [Salinimicrobium oceani]NJW52955.1 MgtC/SapB family protein [Salinimicrobium oceani]